MSLCWLVHLFWGTKGYNCNNHGTIRLSTLNNLQSYSSGNSAGNIHTVHCCFVSGSDWSLWVPPLVMMSLLRFWCPQWTFCSIHLHCSPPASFLPLTQSMWLQAFTSLLSNRSLQIQYLAFVFPLWWLVPHLWILHRLWSCNSCCKVTTPVLILKSVSASCKLTAPVKNCSSKESILFKRSQYIFKQLLLLPPISNPSQSPKVPSMDLHKLTGPWHHPSDTKSWNVHVWWWMKSKYVFSAHS